MKPLLIESGTGALGWRRLRPSEAARSPAGFELQQSYRRHAVRALLHERQLTRVLARLRAAGVQALLGRGWAAARHYPEAGLRPYRDFEVYVAAGQHEAARRALEKEESPVVLHVGCADLNDRTWSQVEERAQSVHLAGGQVRVLGAEDHLRLLALQMLRRGAYRPLWLCDLAAVVETTRGAFDWDRFLSGDRRRTDWSCCALVLARDLIEADLAGAPPQVTSRALPHWLTRCVLRQWSLPSAGPRLPRAPAAAKPAPPPPPPGAWPNPIEATIGLGGPINAMPRLPFQLAECFSRTALRALRRPRAAAG
ncbi:MAG TPA: nucleotidyltransferase family protein [Vicinamibacteria bacterium]|nr:nucleotidyltransferase family protein [Vicinamibacteria bacterium]